MVVGSGRQERGTWEENTKGEKANTRTCYWHSPYTGGCWSIPQEFWGSLRNVPLEGQKSKAFIHRLLVKGVPWPLTSPNFWVVHTLALNDSHWSSQGRRWDVKGTSISEMLKVVPAQSWLPKACADLVTNKRSGIWSGVQMGLMVIVNVFRFKINESD